HGFNGLRQVLDEYLNRPGWRVFAHTMIWSATVFLIGIGTYAILMFQQDTAYINQWKAAAWQKAMAARGPTGPPAVSAPGSPPAPRRARRTGRDRSARNDHELPQV